MKNVKYIILAFLAAILYAICTPISKLLQVNDIVSPVMLAGLLYFGAGIGTGIMFIFSDKSDKSKLLNKSDNLYVALMIILDVIAPILMMYGIKYSNSSSASLLNNFEIVATSLIAFIIFKEKTSIKLLISLIIIVIASLLLCINVGEKIEFSIGSLLVILASSCWGLENNCTRRLSSKNKQEIVMVKGLICGLTSIVISLIVEKSIPELKYIIMILVLGFLTYGLSIFVYVIAQEGIGAAKTSAFYAVNPFIATSLSFIILNEKISYMYVIALVLMIIGSVILIIDTLNIEKIEKEAN